MSMKHNDANEIYKNCIRFGANASLNDEECTVSFYHDNDPVFNQMFSVSTPNNMIEVDIINYILTVVLEDIHLLNYQILIKMDTNVSIDLN